MIRIFIGLVGLLIGSQSFAASCDDAERDKVEYFSERAADRIVKKRYGGGQDIVMKLKSCDYNSYSNKFKARIEIYWSGAVFSSNKYNSDGELTMNFNGSNAKYSETYANAALRDYQESMMVLSGAFALGALGAAAESGGNSSEGYLIEVHNACREATVDVAIRYKDLKGRWKTDYWWTFSPNKKSVLVSEGARLRTNSAEVYYYAVQRVAPYWKWVGEHKFWVDGEEIYMRKLVDRHGASNIKLTCSS